MHLAAALGLSGQRTLVVDLDPQGFLTRMLGVEEPPEEASSLILFDPQTEFHSIQVTPLGGFDLLPSSTSLTKAMRRLNKPTDVFWVKETLETGSNYDVVMFDTAAAITVFSLNALVACENTLIPVMPEYQPVLGAEQTFKTAMMVRDKLNPSMQPPLFLFTMVDGRKRNHQAYRKYLRKQYKGQVMTSIIRTSTSLSLTHNDGKTVFEHDPYSRGAIDYANATDELFRLIAPEKKLHASALKPSSGTGHAWKPLQLLS